MKTTQSFPPAEEWQRGQASPLPQITAGVTAKVVELLLQFMRSDNETQVCDALFILQLETHTSIL